MTVSVILPTFNEAATAPTTIKGLRREFDDPEIVVVDDNSPDGTAVKIAEQFGTDVHVCVRQDESGLASAVVRGFDIVDHTPVLVMDADGQHRPRDARKLVEAVESGVDCAVGSRYVADSGSSADWGLDRTVTSAGAALLAWAALPEARMLQDATSGFFAVRRSLVESVRRDLNPDGFKILLEVLAHAPVSSVAEVPIQFEPRQAGASNLDGGEVVKYLRHLRRLATVSRRPWRPVREQVQEVEP